LAHHRPLAGRNAVVTGAARGLGLGIARRLRDDGAKVAVWDYDLAGLDAASEGFALAQDVDVADAARVADAFAEAAGALGGVDILVNNAGINGPVLPTEDYPLDAWARVIAINLSGVFHGTRAAIPHMRARGWGRIVNVASVAGKEGVAGIACYSASKGGVIAFTKAVAKEVVGCGITVNAIAPAMLETPLQAQMTPEHIAAMKAKIPMGRFLEVEEAAAMVAWIAGPECSFTTGFAFDLTGGRATY
jgi:3-oxoacyl-[acyl-carrier protein] reductase